MPNDLNDIHRLIEIADRNDIEVKDETNAETAIQMLLENLKYEANHVEHEINFITKYLLKTYGLTTSADDYYDPEDEDDVMMAETLVPFTNSSSNTT